VTAANAWLGDYYDGRTGRQHPVEVFLGPIELQVRLPDGTQLDWRYVDLQQTHGHFHGDPITLEHGGPIPATLVMRQPEFLGALRRAARQAGQRFEGPLETQRWLTRLLIGVAGSIVLVVALFQVGLPLVSDSLSRFVPVTWERAMGRQALAQLAPQAIRCTNPTLHTQLNALVDRLTAPLPGRYDYEVIVAEASWFNAFAPPGGYIVVFRPLLQTTASVEELAGVLAHEIQHIEQRHATRAMIRQLSMGAMLSAIAGEVTGLSRIGSQTGQALLALGHSRETEEEADREAVRLLDEAGIGVEGMVRFLERLEQRRGESHVPEYLSTHPQTASRLLKVKALAMEQRRTPQSVALAQPWKNLTALCR
jgi:predicted Zn-dependent protease